MTDKRDPVKRRAWRKKWEEKNRAKLNEQHRAWIKAHPEYEARGKEWSREWKAKLSPEELRLKRNEYQRTWKAKNPDKAARIARGNALRVKYGIGHADYDRMLADQNGRCALCGTDAPGSHTRGKGESKFFVVDHDHKTGAIRDLLCFKCNSGIGQLEDSIELLEAAVAYLKKHQVPARAP